MNRNFDIFKDKFHLIDEYNLAIEIAKDQAMVSNEHGFIDPFIRIISDYPSGIVEFDILKDSVNGLQKLVMSAYNFVYGSKSQKGRLPSHIIEESKLLITGTVPGSFIVTFDAAINKRTEIEIESQLSLDLNDNTSENEKLNSIDLLEEVMIDLTNMTTDVEAKEFLKKHGVRTYREASNFLNVIKNYDIELDVGFGYLGSDTVRLDRKNTTNTIAFLEHEKLTTIRTQLDFSGKLVGVNNRKRELIFETDEQRVIIMVLDDSLNHFEMVTNNQYSFLVEKEVIEDVVREKIISTNYTIDSVKSL